MAATRRPWWVLYGLGVLLTLLALGWVSTTVLELGEAERKAQVDRRRQHDLRLALWRMDSWLGPQLTAEVARLPGEYQAYMPQPVAYTTVLNQIEPGEVLVPSPLLTFESPIIRLHFEVDSEGSWSSPQIPAGNSLDLAEASGCIEPLGFARRGRALEGLRSTISYAELIERLGGAEENFGQLFESDSSESWIAQTDSRAKSPLLANQESIRERGWRAKLVQQYQIPVELDGLLVGKERGGDVVTKASPAMSSSPLVPLWIDVPGREPLLCFARRVLTERGWVVQGFEADWPRLRSGLIALVKDLLPEATVLPQLEGDPRADEEGRLLATMPAMLHGGELPVAANSTWTPAEKTLLFGWLVALSALGVVGLSLRSSIRYGEQRSRFAGAVTHELRTPLTTFRLYSDMLSTGLVPDAQRQEYLETLKLESDRLMILVENVLSYARLERGRAALQRGATTHAELLDRAVPALERRLEEVGMRLKITGDPAEDVELATDPDAVAQILLNLVDNACKYGRAKGVEEVEIEVSRGTGCLEYRVRDQGGGIPPGARRAIFEAFERGGSGISEHNPGVGLGLSISRGLARDLGGDLTLEAGSGGPGACFCLWLPLGPGRA